MLVRVVPRVSLPVPLSGALINPSRAAQRRAPGLPTQRAFRSPARAVAPLALRAPQGAPPSKAVSWQGLARALAALARSRHCDEAVEQALIDLWGRADRGMPDACETRARLLASSAFLSDTSAAEALDFGVLNRIDDGAALVCLARRDLADAFQHPTRTARQKLWLLDVLTRPAPDPVAGTDLVWLREQCALAVVQQRDGLARERLLDAAFDRSVGGFERRERQAFLSACFLAGGKRRRAVPLYLALMASAACRTFSEAVVQQFLEHADVCKNPTRLDVVVRALLNEASNDATRREMLTPLLRAAAADPRAGVDALACYDSLLGPESETDLLFLAAKTPQALQRCATARLRPGLSDAAAQDFLASFRKPEHLYTLQRALISRPELQQHLQAVVDACLDGVYGAWRLEQSPELARHAGAAWLPKWRAGAVAPAPTAACELIDTDAACEILASSVEVPSCINITASKRYALLARLTDGSRRLLALRRVEDGAVLARASWTTIHDEHDAPLLLLGRPYQRSGQDASALLTFARQRAAALQLPLVGNTDWPGPRCTRSLGHVGSPDLRDYWDETQTDVTGELLLLPGSTVVLDVP